MSRNHQVFLCAILTLAGCSERKPEPVAEVPVAVQGPTDQERELAIMKARIELADIRAKRDQLVNLRLMMMTNGKDLTPEQEVEHTRTVKGLEEIEQRLLKTIAENESR